MPSRYSSPASSPLLHWLAFSLYWAGSISDKRTHSPCLTLSKVQTVIKLAVVKQPEAVWTLRQRDLALLTLKPERERSGAVLDLLVTEHRLKEVMPLFIFRKFVLLVIVTSWFQQHSAILSHLVSFLESHSNARKDLPHLKFHPPWYPW